MPGRLLIQAGMRAVGVVRAATVLVHVLLATRGLLFTAVISACAGMCLQSMPRQEHSRRKRVLGMAVNDEHPEKCVKASLSAADAVLRYKTALTSAHCVNQKQQPSMLAAP